MDAVAALERRAEEFARLREVLLMALVVTLPLSAGVVIWSASGGQDDVNRRISMSPFDLALAALVIVAVVDRRAPMVPRPRSWTVRIALASGVVLAAAFVAHPSPRGIDLACNILAALAVIDALTRLSSDARRRTLAVIAIVGSVEALIAFFESAKGGAVGLGPLEYSGAFVIQFGTSTAARAGFDHPYHLACFLLVALCACFIAATRTQRRAPWFVAAALIGGALATTYSRTVLLTLVAMFGIAVLGRSEVAARRTRRQIAAMAAVAFLVGAVAFGNGWISRGADTSTGQNIDRQRMDYAREAARLTRDHPLLGVGPGRYTIALQSIPNKALLPAHNIVLFEAAEGGVLAGILAGLLLIAIALRAARRGAGPALVFSALVLFFLLDAYPYAFSTGIAISSLWLGLQELAAEPHAVRD